MIAERDVPGWVPLQTEGRGTHQVRASWTLRKNGGFLDQGKLDLAEGARGVRRSSGQARHLGGGAGVMLYTA